MTTGVSKHELERHRSKHPKKESKKKEVEHATIEKLDDGFVTKTHTHGMNESCAYGDEECGGEEKAHKSHHGAMKHLREAFQADGSTQEKAEEED